MRNILFVLLFLLSSPVFAVRRPAETVGQLISAISIANTTVEKDSIFLTFDVGTSVTTVPYTIEITEDIYIRLSDPTGKPLKLGTTDPSGIIFKFTNNCSFTLKNAELHVSDVLGATGVLVDPSCQSFFIQNVTFQGWKTGLSLSGHSLAPKIKNGQITNCRFFSDSAGIKAAYVDSLLIDSCFFNVNAQGVRVSNGSVFFDHVTNMWFGQNMGNRFVASDRPVAPLQVNNSGYIYFHRNYFQTFPAASAVDYDAYKSVSFNIVEDFIIGSDGAGGNYWGGHHNLAQAAALEINGCLRGLIEGNVFGFNAARPLCWFKITTPAIADPQLMVSRNEFRRKAQLRAYDTDFITIVRSSNSNNEQTPPHQLDNGLTGSLYAYANEDPASGGKKRLTPQLVSFRHFDRNKLKIKVLSAYVDDTISVFSSATDANQRSVKNYLGWAITTTAGQEEELTVTVNSTSFQEGLAITGTKDRRTSEFSFIGAPATPCLVVNTLTGDGPGTLEWAIGCANYQPGRNNIVFNLPDVPNGRLIKLLRQVTITDPIDIIGPGGTFIEIAPDASPVGQPYILLASAATGSNIKNLAFRHFSSLPTGAAPLTVQANNVLVENSIFEDNARGIAASANNVQLKANTFTSQTQGILLQNDQNSKLTWNKFYVCSTAVKLINSVNAEIGSSTTFNEFRSGGYALFADNTQYLRIIGNYFGGDHSAHEIGVGAAVIYLSGCQNTTVGEYEAGTRNYFTNYKGSAVVLASDCFRLAVKNNYFGLTSLGQPSAFASRIFPLIKLDNSHWVVIGDGTALNRINAGGSTTSVGSLNCIEAYNGSQDVQVLNNEIVLTSTSAVTPFSSGLGTTFQKPALEILDAGAYFRYRVFFASGRPSTYRNFRWQVFKSNSRSHLLSLIAVNNKSNWSNLLPKAEYSHIIANQHVEKYPGGVALPLQSSEFTDAVSVSCPPFEGADSIAVVCQRGGGSFFPGDTLSFSAPGADEAGFSGREWVITGPKSGSGTDSDITLENCPEGQYKVTLRYSNGNCWREVTRDVFVSNTIKPVITKVVPAHCTNAATGYLEFSVAFDTIIPHLSYLLAGPDTIRNFTRLTYNAQGSTYRVGGLHPGNYSLILKPAFAQGLEVLTVYVGATQPVVNVERVTYLPCQPLLNSLRGRVVYSVNYDPQSISYQNLYRLSLTTATGLTLYTGAYTVTSSGTSRLDSIQFLVGNLSQLPSVQGELVLKFEPIVPDATPGCNNCYTTVCSAQATFVLPKPVYSTYAMNAAPGANLTFVACANATALPQFVLREQEPQFAVTNRKVFRVIARVHSSTGARIWQQIFIDPQLPFAFQPGAYGLGRYQLTLVIDSSGSWNRGDTLYTYKRCVVKDSFFVRPPVELPPITLSKQPSKCNDGAGSATINAAGYYQARYYWQRKLGPNLWVTFDSASGFTRENLYRHDWQDSLIYYKYIVKDGFGCEYSGTFQIDTLPAPAKPAISIKGCEVKATMQASAVQSVYTIYWYKNAVHPDSILFTSVLAADSIRQAVLPPRNLPDSALLIIKTRNIYGCWSDTASKLYVRPEIKRQIQLCIKWAAPPAKPVSPTPIVIIPPIDGAAAANALDAQGAGCKQANLSAVSGVADNLCLTADGYIDTLKMQYRQGIEHTTLYFHDRAGNLVATVPPQAVENLSSKPTSRATLPAYQMATYYRYNTLGQKILEISPDADTTWFIYDQAGRLRLQRTAAQKDSGQFAYFKYDALGRQVESGVAANGFTPMPIFARGESIGYLDSLFNKPDHAQFNDYPQPDASKTMEKTLTVYNLADASVSFYGSPQRNLINKISKTLHINAHSTLGPAAIGADTVYTWYSYDPHGNVEWLVQQLPGFGRSYIAYDYDLVSGKVKCVRLNPGRQDQFYTRYTYDLDNRITRVETSRDSLLWEADARYDYYLHGPLKRTVLGHDSVQGLDYTYTLNGWLKGINSPDGSGDLGNDGALSRGTAKDAFAMRISYFSGDYVANNAFATGNSLLGGQQNLYNGNIARIDEMNREAHPFQSTAVSHVYNYDKLNRIKASKTVGLSHAKSLATNYSYDANGNLMSLNRWDGQGNRLDSLVYSYETGKNRLKNVHDRVSTPGRSDDIEDSLKYRYDRSGRLVEDKAQKIFIDWNAANKVRLVKQVPPTGPPTYTEYLYDAKGDKVASRSWMGTEAFDHKADYYVRAADGNVLANYEKTVESGSTTETKRLSYSQTEIPLYGSDRVGLARANRVKQIDNLPLTNLRYRKHNFGHQEPETQVMRQLGQKEYELHDHLGNVRSVVSDVRRMPDVTGGFVADVVNRTDYYPFGMKTEAVGQVAVAKRPGSLNWEVLAEPCNYGDVMGTFDPGATYNDLCAPYIDDVNQIEYYLAQGCYRLTFTDPEYLNDPSRIPLLYVTDGMATDVVNGDLVPDSAGNYFIEFCLEDNGQMALSERTATGLNLLNFYLYKTTERTACDTAMMSIQQTHLRWNYVDGDPGYAGQTTYYTNSTCSSTGGVGEPSTSQYAIDYNFPHAGLQRSFKIIDQGKYRITLDYCDPSATAALVMAVEPDGYDNAFYDLVWQNGGGSPTGSADSTYTEVLQNGMVRVTAILNNATANSAYTAFVYSDYPYIIHKLKVELVKDSLVDTLRNNYSRYRYAYNGKEWLLTGLADRYDYGFRMYDPAVGRFLSVDPLADHPNQIGLSTYSAFWNNPVLLNDPDGRCPTCPAAAVGAVVGGLVGGGIEMATQYYKNGAVTDWGAVGGSALQGAVTGGVAGLTAGASLAVTAGAAGVANVTGGIASRAIQGKETAVKDIAIDAAVGIAGGAAAKVGAAALSKFNSRFMSPAASSADDVTEGGLNLFKFGKESTTSNTGWKPGDRMLLLLDKGSPKANWKQNSGYLRSEMRLGRPIFDSYRSPNGSQIPTGGFLNAERRLLESSGWKYNPSTGAYHGPGQ